MADHTHPSHPLFALLPSEKRYWSIWALTSRLCNSFPQAIRLLNTRSGLTHTHTRTQWPPTMKLLHQQLCWKTTMFTCTVFIIIRTIYLHKNTLLYLLTLHCHCVCNILLCCVVCTFAHALCVMSIVCFVSQVILCLSFHLAPWSLRNVVSFHCVLYYILLKSLLKNPAKLVGWS